MYNKISLCTYISLLYRTLLNRVHVLRKGVSKTPVLQIKHPWYDIQRYHCLILRGQVCATYGNMDYWYLPTYYENKTKGWHAFILPYKHFYYKLLICIDYRFCYLCITNEPKPTHQVWPHLYDRPGRHVIWVNCSSFAAFSFGIYHEDFTKDDKLVQVMFYVVRI